MAAYNPDHDVLVQLSVSVGELVSTMPYYLTGVSPCIMAHITAVDMIDSPQIIIECSDGFVYRVALSEYTKGVDIDNVKKVCSDLGKQLTIVL